MDGLSPLGHAGCCELALVFAADPDGINGPRGLLAQTTSLGRGVLAEKPGREIVVGAVTQPWMANVVPRPAA